MKIFLYSDVHWSESSSIIKGRGDRYSQRLENLIKSVSWAENIGSGCDMVVCLGDFFDKPNLSAEEITALSEIQWADKPHYFLVGNHDANINDLSFASTYVFTNSNFHIVSEPTKLDTVSSIFDATTNIYFIPYIIEDNREKLSTYISSLNGDANSFSDRTIVLSHNDLAGINYGNFISTDGFDVEEIKQTCNLFINGHLHNAGFVDEAETILNLGNLSGQNFSEDAFTYDHFCVILDTESLELTFISNPYAFRFYKIHIDSKDQISLLDDMRSNAVVSIVCNSKLVQDVKDRISKLSNIVSSRISVSFDSIDVNPVEISKLAAVDHLKQFSDYILTHLDNNEIVKEELSRVII